RTRSLPSTALFWPVGSATRRPSIPFWGSFATPRSRLSALSKPAPAWAILRPSQPRLTNSREPRRQSAPRGSPLQLHCSSAPAKPATTVPAAGDLDLWRASCAARWPRLMARVELTASLTAPNFTSIPWRHEHVADAPHSANGLRPTRINLDLAAQPRNPQIDRPIERLHFSVRGDLEQPIPIKRAIAAKTLRRSYSLAESVSSLPSAGSTRTRFSRSRIRRPKRTRGPMDGAPPVARRSTLLTRAKSSRGSNGLPI